MVKFQIPGMTGDKADPAGRSGSTDGSTSDETVFEVEAVSSPPRIDFVWVVVAIINLSQSFTLGLNYTILNAPRGNVELWIEQQLAANETTTQIQSLNNQPNNDNGTSSTSLQSTVVYSTLVSIFIFGALLGSVLSAWCKLFVENDISDIVKNST